MVNVQHREFLARACSHDWGFQLTTSMNVGISPHIPVWLCRKCESFHLNFNPEIFPEGVAYVEAKHKKELGPFVKSRG